MQTCQSYNILYLRVTKFNFFSIFFFIFQYNIRLFEIVLISVLSSTYFGIRLSYEVPDRISDRSLIPKFLVRPLNSLHFLMELLTMFLTNIAEMNMKT